MFDVLTPVDVTVGRGLLLEVAVLVCVILLQTE